MLNGGAVSLLRRDDQTHNHPSTPRRGLVSQDTPHADSVSSPSSRMFHAVRPLRCPVAIDISEEAQRVGAREEAATK